MRGRLRPGLLLAMAMLAAGCSDSPEAEAASGPEFGELGLDATKTTGVVRGVVVDSSIAPVPDALVVLSPGGLETTTNGEGVFGYDDVDPGTYFVRATKPGYAPTQQSAEVQAGVDEPPVVRVLLERLPGTEPYALEQHYSAYISCGFKLANFVFDAFFCDPLDVLGMQSNDDSAPVFEVDNLPDFFQSEMLWDSTQLLGSDLVTIQEACSYPDCADPIRTCNVRGPSPLVCRVNATAGGGGGGVGLVEAGMGEGRGYRVGMFANCVGGCVLGAVGAGVVLEQPVEIYNFLFYNYQPPEDWLFVETSKVPGPPPP